MKKHISIITALICIPNQLLANTVYDSYQQFYETYSNRVFKPPPKNATIKNTIKTIGKEKYLAINRHLVNIKNIITFDQKKSSQTDFEDGSKIFESLEYTCLEGQRKTSGTESRYTPIYLIKKNKTTPIVFKLPGLFNSCSAIRKDQENKILFFLVEYRYGDTEAEIESNGYKTQQKQIEGTNLTEYKIHNQNFIKTGKSISTIFLEPENFYKFRIETQSR